MLTDSDYLASTVIIDFFFRFLRCYRELLTSRLLTMKSDSNKVRKKICLFGTSANPPTGQQGHGGIVRALSDLCMSTISEGTSSKISEKGDEGCLPLCFDEIRVVPVYRHMYAVRRLKVQGNKSLSDFLIPGSIGLWLSSHSFTDKINVFEKFVCYR